MTPRGIPKPPGFAPKDDPRVGTKPPGTATAGCPHSRAVPCPLPPVLTWVATGDRPRLCGRDITRVPMSPPPQCVPRPPQLKSQHNPIRAPGESPWDECWEPGHPGAPHTPPEGSQVFWVSSPPSQYLPQRRSGPGTSPRTWRREGRR